ncbi:MAG TPA: hypothetical protein VK151_08635 [Fluviicola sp.]|nr:hypothetical protein [Fluviicola sp.]
MTEETKKKKPDFYIFEGIEGNKDKIIGSVYLHKKGKGFNLLMGKKVYKVFPRKEAQQQKEGGA